MRNNKSKINIKKLQKEVNGITLIALVVTIIVLVILAGVAINLTIGDNGVVNKSKMATEKWEEASKNEQNELNKAEEIIDDYLNNGQGTDGEKATAIPSDVLKGRTYYDEHRNLHTGTLEILDTSDATAIADNISEGKTAYVNGNKVIGTGKDVDDAYNNGLNDGKGQISLKSKQVSVSCNPGLNNFSFSEGTLVGVSYVGDPYNPNNALQGAGISDAHTYWVQCAHGTGGTILITLVYY